MTTLKRPKTGMILAAGMGKRMRPLSAITPKPLITVGGKAIIDRPLTALERAGVDRTVINVHYLADLIEVHVKQYDKFDIVISDERDGLLETGGGVTKALPHLGKEPFYLLNSDSFWMEGSVPNLDLLAHYWIDETMDALLLLAPTVTAVGYKGRGDFLLDPHGRLRRRKAHEVSPYVYSGAAIMHPRLFKDAPAGSHSLNAEFDKAIENGRLYGLIMDGTWMHVGTPRDIRSAERALAESATGGRQL
ncbi:nucleotidyltransferase family protein [Cohaesibacter marisflavi]|uniref:nucleotidyltransferase family protein n=1 Tax=Cohaesibacter marisflavi TaxID=655353 RepID=UPI0029C75CDF|nr:nucleotidyltransferase family protein [Cohaesibacter marisflavi]